MDDDGISLCPLVGKLAAYLRAHPFACDTADGMRHWWFETEVGMNELMAALEWMRLHQLVEELKAADGRVRYRRLASVERLGALIGDIGIASDDAA